MGKRIHYYFNYSASEVRPKYSYRQGTDLLTGRTASNGQELVIGAWDVAIVEETTRSSVADSREDPRHKTR